VVKIFQWLSDGVTIEDIDGWFAKAFQNLDRFARQLLTS